MPGGMECSCDARGAAVFREEVITVSFRNLDSSFLLPKTWPGELSSLTGLVHRTFLAACGEDYSQSFPQQRDLAEVWPSRAIFGIQLMRMCTC